jgi:hypothetical protein
VIEFDKEKHKTSDVARQAAVSTLGSALALKRSRSIRSRITQTCARDTQPTMIGAVDSAAPSVFDHKS